MELADWIHVDKRSDHSSGGTLHNGVYSSEAASVIEIDNDPSESSCDYTETCDGKSSGKCLDASKLDEHLQLSNDSAAIHATDSVDEVSNGDSGVLQGSSNSDDKVMMETDDKVMVETDDKVVVETDIAANLCPETTDSVETNSKLHTEGAGKNDDGEIKTGKDESEGAASDELVSSDSDSSTDVADLEAEMLALAAAVAEASEQKNDSVDVRDSLDSGTISRPPCADGVDGGLSVADPGDTAATETPLVPVTVNQDEVDDADEMLSDDSVICLDNDDDSDASENNSCRTEAKYTCARRNLPPVYIQVVRKEKLSNVTLGSIASVCPVGLPAAPSAGSSVPLSSNMLLKSGSLPPATNAMPGLNIPTTNWLMKQVVPVIASSGQHTPLDKNRCSRPMAMLLSDIGLQLVSRRVRANRIAQQKRKLRKSRGKRSNSNALDKFLNFPVDPALTDHLRLKMLRCSCGFTTESTNILELHYELGRESGGPLHCCVCDEYSARYPGQFVRHMELDHGRKVVVQPRPPTYSCQLCYFDTNGRVVYERHVKSCQKLFTLRSNQKPALNHSDIPLEKTEQPKPKPVNRLVDFRAKAVSAQSDPVNSRSALPAGERGPQQNLFRIGSHVFIVVSKTGDNASSSSLKQTSVLHVDKCPAPATQTTMALTRTVGQSTIGQSTSLVQLASQSSVKSSRVAPGMLATSVLPLSNKAVVSDSIWVSKLAAAAANSVVSSYQPAASKSLTQPPPLKTSLTTVSKLLSINEPSRCVSPASNSTTVSKLLLKNQSDQMGLSSVMTSTSSVSIPPRISLLPAVSTAPAAATPTPILARPVLPQTIAKSSGVSRPLTSSQPNGYVVCPLCNGFVKDVQALNIHMRVVHKTGSDWATKLFQCGKCAPVRWYSSRDALFKHQLGCHNICKGSSQGYCSRCELSGISDLIEHFRQTHNVTLFSMFKSRNCSFCRMQLEGQRAFESHMLSSHKNLFPSLSSLVTKVRNSGPKNSCRICRKGDIIDLVRHMETRHRLKLNEMLRQFYCYFCLSRLQDALGFENHMLQVHKNVFSSLDMLWDEIFASRLTSGYSDATDGFCGAFKCSVCDDEFVSASYRYRHLVISHPKRSYVCSLCRMSCGSKQSLMRHLKLRHTRSCSVPVQRLGHDTFERHYHCTEDCCSGSSIDLCSSPETVVITDEDEDTVEEPLPKKSRLIDDGLGSRNIPPESIEEVLEIDGDTVIIVQESDCC